MKLITSVVLSLMLSVSYLLVNNAIAADAAKPEAAADEAVPVFDQAYMENAENITAGGEVWKQCRHCHGASAYPGKAPKLKPARMEPDFIWDRVTNGFRKMPPWKAVFSKEQRMQVVAYIKSKQFSP